jgi:hypothetical protein
MNLFSSNAFVLPDMIHTDFQIVNPESIGYPPCFLQFMQIAAEPLD